MTRLPYSSQFHAIFSLFAFISPTWSVDSSTVVFFDRFGDCWSEKDFFVHAEPVTVNAQGSGEIYQIIRCELKFKTDPNEKLCLKVNTINIGDCSVKLLAYGGKDAKDDTQLASYDCGSDAATVCSNTNYLTLVLQKGRISATDYNFQLQILQEKVGNKSQNGQGQGGIFVSLTVLVAIIVGVALLIAIVVFVIMYCWRRKSKHHGKVHRQKRKDARPGRSAGSDLPSSGTPLQPSAPPHPDLDLPVTHDPGFDNRRFMQSYPMEPPPPYELPSPKSQDVPPVRV